MSVFELSYMTLVNFRLLYSAQRKRISHSIPNPASQFQIADHKAYSVPRPQSIPFRERCSSEPRASLVSEQWAKKCQQERKSLALGDAINIALVPG